MNKLYVMFYLIAALVISNSVWLMNYHAHEWSVLIVLTSLVTLVVTIAGFYKDFKS